MAADAPPGQERDRFESFRDRLREDPESAVERFLATLFRGTPDVPGHVARFHARFDRYPLPSLPVLERGLDLLEDSDLRACLGKIRVPALWIAGAEDPLVPAAACEWAAQSMPQADVQRIEGAGHAPFLTHEEEVRKAIVDFVGREEAP